jgi:manganese efflux pump family protein
LTVFDFASIFLIALSLSADCFAVALSGAVALKKVALAQVLRMSVCFGAFQTGMQLAGWLAGKTVVDLIAGYDHWIAFGLLAFIGGRMLLESLHEENEAKKGVDITRGFPLIALSVATSIDSLAVGLSYAFIDISIALPSILAGVIAFAVTIAGFMLGRKVGELFGRRAETVGGVVLIGIGIRILVEHLLG